MKRLPCLVVLSALTACAAPAAPPAGVAWDALVGWESKDGVQCVRTGDIDPASPGPEVVGVDTVGRVIVVRVRDGKASGELVHEHGAELTGLLVADVDPRVPGNEIYAGGAGAGEAGGAVVQIVRDGDGWRARTVFTTDGFVHSIARLAPVRAGDAPSLVAVTYAAQVVLADLAGADAPWATRVLHQEPQTDVPEGNELKDVVTGAIGGGPPRQVFFVSKSGRAVLLDADAPGSARVLHDEPGGIARVALEPSGDLVLACTAGRVLRLHREGDAWSKETLFHEVGPLRGVVAGRFAATGGTAPLAVYGYTQLCRTLRPRNGAWDSDTVFRDEGRGHWLAAADLVPAAEGDELALASYSGRIVILVARREPQGDRP